MGHTVPSQRQVVENIIAVLQRYKDSLRKEEREIIDEFIRDVYKHTGSISYGNTYHFCALVIISVLLEQRKKA